MTAFAFKRVRTAQELRDAADALTRAGYEACAICERWFKFDTMVPDMAFHTVICVGCRHQQDIDAVTPRFED